MGVFQRSLQSGNSMFNANGNVISKEILELIVVFTEKYTA